MDPDELLQNAKALCKKTSEYQHVIPPDLPVGKQCSEIAWAELLDECEGQFNQMLQLQRCIEETEGESYEHLPNETENRQYAVEAELKQWMDFEPKLLPTNPEVLLAVGKEELTQLTGQLELVLSCSQAKKDKLEEILKSEQKWLEEKKEVFKAATELEIAMRQENDRLSKASVLEDMKKRIQKVKTFQDNLLDTLSDVLAEHFPLPQMDGNLKKKKKNIPVGPSVEFISLHDILELLMNKMVETPHQPYVTIDETFWPPYIEMLLRYGVASRHPDECYKIRLEVFC